MRLKKLSSRTTGEHSQPAHTTNLLDVPKPADNQTTRTGLSYWKLGVQQVAVPPVPVKKSNTWRFQFAENPFYEFGEREQEPEADGCNLSPHAVLDPAAKPDLSESARREVMRIALLKRGQVARTLALATPAEPEPGDPEPETKSARAWNCSGANSLNAIVSSGQDTLQNRDPVASTASISSVNISSVRSAIESQQLDPLSIDPRKPELPPSRLPNHQIKDSNPYRDYSDTALMLLAQSANTDAETLFWLSGNQSADIRGAVARSTKCPLEALSILAKDPEAGIRHSIAENPGSSMHILRMLAEDKNPLVAWRAQDNINSKRNGRTTTQIRLQQPAPKPESAVRNTREHPILPCSADLAASEETIAFLKLIAIKTNTPPRRLSELARHPDPTVRAAVAENANTPLEMLWILARDIDQEVKIKVTDNYNCPEEILEALKDDADSYVAWQARNVLQRLNSTNYSSPGGGPNFDGERSSGGNVRGVTRP